MNSFYEKSRTALARILVLLLAIVVSAPNVAFSQEELTTNASSTTQEIDVATSTATSTATTTSEIQTEMTEDDMPLPEEPDEESEEDAPVIEQPAAVALSIPAPKKLKPFTREFKRRIISDNEALHNCAAETFKVDLTGKSSTRTRIMLARNGEVPYEVEIGGLPQGINITFSNNSDYLYFQNANDRFLELTITNKPNSQKGNFSVPIIYTRKGSRDSSVICQMNIINS